MLLVEVTLGVPSSPVSQGGELPQLDEESALVANMESAFVSCEKGDQGRKGARTEGRPGSRFSMDVFLDAKGVGELRFRRLFWEGMA